MLIVCPKCFAQYAVSDEIRIKKGQKFHCSACQNYFVLPQKDNCITEDESEIIPTVSSVMQSTNQPVQPSMGTTVSTPQPTETPTPSLIPTPVHLQPTATQPVPVTQTEQASTHLTDPLSRPFFTREPTAQSNEPRFEEPLSLLANEKPNPDDRLDSIPEEFKPVQQSKKKKSSFAATLFWLLIAVGICGSAYMQKDFLFQQLDSFILNHLDKNTETFKSDTTQSVETTKSQSKQTTKNKEKTKSIQSEKETRNKQAETTNQLKNSIKKAMPVQQKNETNSPVKQASVISSTEKEETTPSASPIQPEQNTVSDKQSVEKTDSPVKQAPVISSTKKEETTPPASPIQSEQNTVSDKQSVEGKVVKNESNQDPAQSAENKIEKNNLINESNQPNTLLSPVPNTHPSVDSHSPVLKTETNSLPPLQTVQNSSVSTEVQPTKPQTAEEDTTNSIPHSDESRIQESLEELKEPTEKTKDPVESNDSPKTTQIIREQTVVPSSFAPLAEQASLSPSDIARILKIREISYSIAPNEAGVMRLMIKGEIANTELKTLIIPELKAVVYNEEDMVIARKRIILTQAQIEGNSVQPFFSSVVPAPAQVSRVEVVFDE